MRSSEIAGWHAAAGTCLIIALGMAARRTWSRWLALAGVAVGFGAVFLAGRRKMIGEIALFVVFYGVLVLWHQKGTSRRLQQAVAALPFAVLGYELVLGDSDTSRLGPYVERGFSAFADSTGRLREMTIDQFRWVIDRNGWLGSGAGTGAQGSQYFGGGVGLVGGAAEGGMGKVLAELGIPGLLALIWLVAILGRSFVRIARLARSAAQEEALLLYGLIAFLPANAAVFLTAHQVYGDPFVLLVIGWISGAILGYPRARATADRLEWGRSAGVEARRNRGSVAA